MASEVINLLMKVPGVSYLREIIEPIYYKANVWIAKKLISGSGRKRIWLKLATLIENDIPILVALTSLYDRRVKIKGANDFYALALKEWRDNVDNGMPLSAAAKQWIPASELQLLQAGDESGEASGALRACGDLITTTTKITWAIVMGVSYPTILVLIALGLVYTFGVVILPSFYLLAPDAHWTGAAAALVSFSTFIEHYFWYVVGGLFLIFGLFLSSLPRWDGPLRTKLDKAVPYSIYRTVTGSTWLIALSSMIKAGVVLESALKSMMVDASPWLKNRLLACITHYNAGNNFGDALQKAGHDFPDVEIIDDLGIYSSVAGFDVALELIGKEWAEKAVEQVKIQSNVLFIAGIFAVGLLLAFMLLGLFSIQAQLSDILRQ